MPRATTKSATSANIDEQFSKGQQSWDYIAIRKVADHRLRVRLHRDAYDFQSYARVERWDGSKWHEVATRPIKTCACHAASYVAAADIALFRTDAETLFALALAIVA